MSEAEHEAPPPPPPPAVKKRAVPIIIMGATIAIITLIGALYARARAGVNDVALSSEPKGVTVVRARAWTFQARRTYVGTIEPWQQAKIGPQLVSAYVDSVLVRPGARVKRRDVLATLDCRNASALEKAVSMQARALEATQGALANEASRVAGLLDGGYASANEVELKQAESASKQAQLLALQAQMMGTSLQVSDCVLRAPFDGEVADRQADPGAFVRPGTTLLTLIDRSTVRITADVPEADFDAVAPGTAVKLRMFSTGEERTGTVTRRAPAADAATRTLRVELDLENAARTLPVGTTAELVLEVGEPAAAIELPIAAASVRGKKANVFVVDGEVARQRSLEVLGEAQGRLYVAPKSLSEGAQVVTLGRSQLREGDRVAALREVAR